MFRIIGYWLRFSDFIESESGISRFADRCIGKLTDKALKRLEKKQKENANLEVKLKSLRESLSKINAGRILTYDEFFSVRNRVRVEAVVFWLILISEMFLNYISTLIFIPGEEFLIELMRWAISFVVTGASIIASEKFFEALLPVKPYTFAKQERMFQVFFRVLGLLLLLGFAEYAIMSISEARARDIEGGVVGGTLYYGFIILSMVLPLIAGFLRRDTMQYLDPYKNTRKQQEVTLKIETISKKMEENARGKDNHFKQMLERYWEAFNSFKTYKENFNSRHQITENIQSHFCCNYDSFQVEAQKHYYLKVEPNQKTSKEANNG